MDDKLVIKFVDKGNLERGETYTFLHKHYGIMQGICATSYSFELNYFIAGKEEDEVLLSDVMWVGIVEDYV